MSVAEITDQQYESTVKEGTVLIDFWRTHCPPCQMLAPILNELSETYAGQITFAKINAEEHPEAAARLGIMGLPTLVVYRDGEPVDKIVGFRSKDALTNLLNRYVQKHKEKLLSEPFRRCRRILL